MTTSTPTATITNVAHTQSPQPAQYTIRPASYEDIVGIIETHRSAVAWVQNNTDSTTAEQLEGWRLYETPETIGKYLDNPSCTTLVLTDQCAPTQPLSYLVMGKNDVMKLYTRAEHAVGKGFGRQLIQAAEQCVRHDGYDHMTVTSSPSAEGFYAKMGFVTQRRDQVTFPNGKPIDTPIMKKDLPCSGELWEVLARHKRTAAMARGR